MSKDVIIALDFPSGKEALAFVKTFNEPVYVKIGMELFYSEGPSIINEIKKLNHKIFLDLKLHDIPNTVKQAMNVLAKLDVDIVNVHCAGGIEMMKQAADVFKDSNTLVIGVTQLTSTNQQTLEDEILINKDIKDVILTYAKNAKKAGLNGIVCSPQEAKLIHEEIGYEFKTVCPGIRYQDDNDDQKRVMNPSLAKEATCDYIVVGRPITKAKNPLEQYRRVYQDFMEV